MSSARERSRQIEEQAASFSFTEKQNEFYRALKTGMYRYMAMGGAIRGTKTFTMIAIMMMLLQRFPRSRGAIVRADLPNLRRNVIPSVEKFRENYLGGWLGPLNQSKWTWHCANGSSLMLMPESIETDPDLDRFKGFETNFFVGEEANELHIKTFYKMIERAGSYIIPANEAEQKKINIAISRGVDPKTAARNWGPEQPPPLIFLTFNPADNWVRELFYDPWAQGTIRAPYYYLPATIADNPYVTDAYVENLKDLPPEEYKRFVLGEWGRVRAPNQLISLDMIVTAKNLNPVSGVRREALDVAAYGGDAIVWAYIDGNALEEIEAWEDEKADPTPAVTNAMWRNSLKRAHDKGIDEANYTIDVVGLGGGPADELQANGLEVNRFVSGGEVFERETQPGVMSLWKFGDLRSQAYWEFREKLRLGMFSLKKCCPQKLVQELLAHEYKITNRVIQVQPKDKVREKLGRSPDYADAVVMAALDWPERDTHWTMPTPTTRRASTNTLQQELLNRGRAVRGRG